MTALLLGLTGFAGAGKDSVAEILERDHGFAREAFANGLKEALLAINPVVEDGVRVADLVGLYGWDDAKRQYPEIRRLLQRTGDEAGRQIHGEQCWVLATMDLLPTEKPAVISDVRYENEAEAVIQDPITCGLIVRVERPGVEAANEHASEGYAATGYAHYTIINDGSLADLEQKVADLLLVIASAE